ncbi:MAG: metal-dependent transcriptional regulator [Capsulimonas sp.]|jgi:DtxR family Mn-dependent transcriptional regulator|uniref:metal-dependent transcriptional regulator n=1 Tax=Capsulimonas sp. TaxID=2494211 RepID=UPI003262E9D6|nr:DtxR family transcriptional regulator [Capsulimonas sp.]
MVKFDSGRATSQAVEDYLKAIYKLQSVTAPVTTSALAEKLGISAAAATKMLKQLDGMRLISYVPYHGANLTDAGRRIALEVIRHHRLIEQYLHQAMGYAWDQVDAEAEKLEHAISEEFEARIDELLGYPETCPHGDPIPRADGVLVDERLQTLGECAAGDWVRIERVRDTDPAVLRDLTQRQMGLHTQIFVSDRHSDNSLTILVAGTPHLVHEPISASVFVTPLTADQAPANHG